MKEGRISNTKEALEGFPSSVVYQVLSQDRDWSVWDK